MKKIHIAQKSRIKIFIKWTFDNIYSSASNKKKRKKAGGTVTTVKQKGLSSIFNIDTIQINLKRKSFILLIKVILAKTVHMFIRKKNTLTINSLLKNKRFRWMIIILCNLFLFCLFVCFFALTETIEMLCLEFGSNSVKISYVAKFNNMSRRKKRLKLIYCMYYMLYFRCIFMDFSTAEFFFHDSKYFLK